MIKDCIVAKLVQGYLTDEGFQRTCSAFQEECALFHDGNNDLDQVFLTADLKTILEDYSQLKEAGRENGIPTSTAVLKSLWKDLDTVIGRLKYATIPSVGPKVNTMGSQATRTRRLNSGRSRRNMLQKNQEISTSTASNPSTMQCSSTPNLSENSAAEKLPLPRLSTAGPSQTSPSSDHTQVTNIPSPCADQNSNTSQMLNPPQCTGAPVPVPVSVSSVSCTSQVTGIPSSFGPVGAPVVGNGCDSHTNSKPSSSNDDATTDSMFDLTDGGAFCNDGDFSNNVVEHCGTKTTPIIIVDTERSKEQQVTTNEEHSLSSSHPSQTESQLLRSPKRKCVQPKKRVPQGCQSTSTVAESPVKLVPQSANKEVELEIMSAPDMLTPQSFLGTLLNTPLLQEKLAENINKVVSSSRVVPAGGDELSSDSTHSVTSTEASSDDVFMTSSQVEGAGGDIPVKEIMDLMQADPAFDVLFSFFGLDALEALPSTTHSSTDLPGAPADLNLNNKTTSPPGSEPQIQDHLGTLSSLPTETMSDLEPGVTSFSGLNLGLNTVDSILENSSLQASPLEVDNPSSSSASDLHMSAASIVTDALLLLAGSPQKKSPSRTSPQLNNSAKVPVSERKNPDTPPRELHSACGSSINDKQPCRQSLVNQPALITSTLPYVRALNFAIGNGPAPSKRGRKKGSKNKNSKRQSITEQREKPRNNKVAISGRTRVIANKASQMTVTSSSEAISCSTVVRRTEGSQVLVNSGSPFNRPILPRSSPANVMMSSASPIPVPYSFDNCVPGFTPSPDNVVSCSSSSVSHVDAVTHPTALPGNHIAGGRGDALTPLTFNISTCPNPSPVNLATSCSFQSATVFSPSSFPSRSCPANLTTLYPPQTLSVGYPVNSTTHPTPSSAGQGSTGSSHTPSSASHSLFNVPVISRTMSAQHVVNTVTTLSSAGLPETGLPGHFTHPRVLPTSTSTGNSVSIQGDQRNQAVVASSSDLSAPAEPLAMQASNFLQTLALKHVSAQNNSSTSLSVAPGSRIGKLAMEGSQNNKPISTVNSAISQPSNENLTSLVNMDVSENNTVAASEKQLAHSSSCVNSVEQESRAAGKSLQNSQESENGNTSSLEILNQECSELIKETSTSVPNSQPNSGGEMQRSNYLQRKRQRDASEPLKKKKSKSSRLSKRSKTGEEGINFPSDLNVEEFLAKLHYEDK